MTTLQQAVQQCFDLLRGVDPAIPLVYDRLTPEEGTRRFPYNDATGKQVTCKPEGNLTIGRGTNLEVGFDDNEIQWTELYRIAVVADQLAGYSWYKGLDPMRASVLLDVGYNGGVNGLLTFSHMLAAISIRDWAIAGEQLLNSQAGNDPKTHGRYVALADLLTNGA